MKLTIDDLHAEIDGKPILKDLSLSVHVGEAHKLLRISLGSVG